MNQFYNPQVQFTTDTDADAINKGRRRNAASSIDWRDMLIILAVVAPITALFGWIGWSVLKMFIR